jgi:hypothetical protein
MTRGRSCPVAPPETLGGFKRVQGDPDSDWVRPLQKGMWLWRTMMGRYHVLLAA